MIDSRADFINTWLLEMPEGLGKFPTFDQIEYNIKDMIKHGGPPIEVAQNVKKIVGSTVMYYWIDDGKDILLGVELYVKPQGLAVTLTGKNPTLVGKPPYASDLYNIILKDNKVSLRLMSDATLSDEGYNIWRRLFQQGHKVSVYDKEQPGKSFITLNSLDDMDKYFAAGDSDFKRYQYILSESGIMLGETRSHFHTRRFRELIPGML